MPSSILFSAIAENPRRKKFSGGLSDKKWISPGSIKMPSSAAKSFSRRLSKYSGPFTQ
jgi:hypothetical protein